MIKPMMILQKLTQLACLLKQGKNCSSSLIRLKRRILPPSRISQKKEKVSLYIHVTQFIRLHGYLYFFVFSVINLLEPSRRSLAAEMRSLR
jgi:hypothetical protein